MSFTVSSQSFAEVTPRAVSLRELLGIHEITFYSDVAVHPLGEGPTLSAELYGAHIMVRGKTQTKPMGYARPEGRVLLKQQKFLSKDHVLFALSMNHVQFSTIEAVRDGGDLDFEVQVMGAGVHEVHGSCAISDNWSFHVPRSAWIKSLAAANVLNIHLFELPVSFGPKTTAEWDVVEHIEKARKYFVEGDYPGCVGECRIVIQELGAKTTGDAEWSDGVLKKLANGDRGASKRERELAIFAAVRSYAHLPHHGSSEGGTVDYNRSDASFAFASVLNIAAHVYRS